MTRFLERLSSMNTPPVFNKTNQARDFSKIFAGTSYFFEKPIITITELSYTITSNLQAESFTALCKSSAVKNGLSRGLGTLILLFLIFFFTVLTAIVFIVVDKKTKSSASIYILLFIPVGFIFSYLLTRRMGADLVPAKEIKLLDQNQSEIFKVVQPKRQKLFENEFHLFSRDENQLTIFKCNLLKDFWYTVWRCYNFQGDLLFTSKRLHMRRRFDRTVDYAFYGSQGELLAELKNGKTSPDTSYELKILSKPELSHLFIAATMCIDFESDTLLMKDF